MSLDLPMPLTIYFEAKNTHNVDAMLDCFSNAARVRDEGRDMLGHVAIRQWMEDTTRKYRVTVAPTRIDQADGKTIVTAQVSGTFPGSPAELRYHFTISGETIASLEIT